MEIIYSEVSRGAMANDTALLSTASSVLDDEVTSNENTMNIFSNDLTVNLWLYGWPPLCMTGLVGNTLVLLVLRRDGLVRTSANAYLTALAVGDSLVLMLVSVTVFPGLVWDMWVTTTSKLACRAVWPLHGTLVDASTWLIVAFTVERCVVVRFPLLKLRLCTPRNAGLCCVLLLVLAFVKSIDLGFILDLSLRVNGSGNKVCDIHPRYMDYMYHYRTRLDFVINSILPAGVVLVCNWAIIGTLRRDLMRPSVPDTVTRAASMCLGVSIAFIVFVVPTNAYIVIHSYCPGTPWGQYDMYWSLVLLRYVNHAINVILYSLTGAHFRRESAAVLRSCFESGCDATRAVHKMSPRLASKLKFRRRFGGDLEIQ